MKFLKRLSVLLFALCSLFFLFYRFYFLRKTERNIPHNSSVFVSPANGKIVSIRNWNSKTVDETKEDFGTIKIWTKDVDTAGTIISIQLNVFNVHYQRAPEDAKLISEKYTHGNFNNAVSMSNEYGIRFENEHNEMLFENTSGKKFKVIQIAGFVARRIEDYVQPNQQVKRGDIIGLIKLGSQVTIILPHNFSVVAKEGDAVIDGETVIAME